MIKGFSGSIPDESLDNDFLGAFALAGFSDFLGALGLLGFRAFLGAFALVGTLSPPTFVIIPYIYLLIFEDFVLKEFDLKEYNLIDFCWFNN